MKFAQIAKRVLLFAAVNLLVVLTISILLTVLTVFFHVRLSGGGYGGLMVLCFVWGMGGAFISLALSRLMAKWFMGVKVIDPNTSDRNARQLVETVHGLARNAGLTTMPEVGYYESPEVNAFATGPSRSRALVAVSTGLLENMRQSEMEGVLGHEIAHITNGDMVTMTLIQGVINAFVMFLARILAFAVASAMRSRDDDRGPGFFMQYMLVQVFQIVLSLLGFMVVAAFSRWREFRADAGGARYAGRENMINALERLRLVHETPIGQQSDHSSPAFQSLKISGKSGGLMALFATHPPLEVRIARLRGTRDY
jgi:heat shock protein HtpX